MSLYSHGYILVHPASSSDQTTVGNHIVPMALIRLKHKVTYNKGTIAIVPASGPCSNYLHGKEHINQLWLAIPLHGFHALYT